jgi:hypothetical protein
MNVSHEFVQDCLMKLLASSLELSRQRRYDWPHRSVWYALLFHRLIKAIPPAVISDVRRLIECCMAVPTLSNDRVAWMPHTHHLFPDAFKVMRVVSGGLVGCC